MTARVKGQMSRERSSLALAFNAGSSSLKFEAFATADPWASRLRAAVRDIGSRSPALELDGRTRDCGRVDTHREAAELILDQLDGRHDLAVTTETVEVSAHRVVHGADRYFAPTRVTPAVLDDLASIADLAPLHMPGALAVMEAVARRLPDVPAVAVFDTALFHALPDVARRYAVPRRWLEADGIRRYGFHGIAHEQMRDHMLRGAGEGPERLVTLQLGHGCSATAFAHGVPVETSMGFTPLEGLVMATRPGDLDAGAVLHMWRRGSARESIDAELNRESGLRGLSDISGDVPELLRLEQEGHEGAALALEAFCHSVVKYLGAYAAVLGGIDAVTFGGGIGENSPVLRRRICERLAWLGLALDDGANDACVGSTGRISTEGSAIDVRVIAVREEATIARAAVDRLRRRSGAAGGATTKAR